MSRCGLRCDFGKIRCTTQRLMLVCNSGRDKHKAGSNGQRIGLSRWDIVVRRREALQKATYLHGELKSRAQRNAPLA